MTGEEPTLVVSEVFGPTVQGEGPSLGRRCSFVRLMGCNLSCSWCDTPFTWDGDRFDLHAEGKRLPVSAIAERALDGGPGLVVISGGEPLLHQRQAGWLALLDRLAAAGVEVEVETNGTVAPTDATAVRVARFNVSPKLGHSGHSIGRRLQAEALGRFADLAQRGAACFKFVVEGPDDFAEVEALCGPGLLPRSAVWVMPLGTTPVDIGQRLRPIAEAAIAAGFNVTTRLHVLAWGDERGR